MFKWLRGVSRLNALEDEVAKLRRDLDDRDLDWVEMRARCKRLLDRTEKAQRAIDNAAQGEETLPSTATEQGGDGRPGSSSMGHILTPRQMQIQQQVLRRRAGLG